jgi:hypothetical protein
LIRSRLGPTLLVYPFSDTGTPSNY